MLNIFTELIINMDKFHYVPTLGFHAKRNQGTVLGGLMTFILGVMIAGFFGDELQAMM